MFTSQTGNFDIQKIHINNKGTYVVSSGEQNSGIIGKTDIDAKIIKPNTITVDMFGNVYFRDHEYKIVTHARVFTLELKQRELSKEVGMYIVAQMHYFKKVFSYNNMASFEKIKDKRLSLPITQEGEIDFDYMENYIRELERERISELETYLQVAGLTDTDLTDEELSAINKFRGGGRKWKEYQINSLFMIATGRDIIISNVKDGDIPLISHKNDDNGVVKYIQNLNNRRIFDYRTTLSLADRGVFYATTQNKDFHIGTRVKALTFKDGIQDETVRLFFVTSINKLQILFKEYLDNATDKLPIQKIQLPVDNKGEIDYRFMEKYIRAIEKQCIKHVIVWKDKIIKTTKEVVG